MSDLRDFTGKAEIHGLKKIDSEHNILKGNFVEIDLRIYKKYFLKPKIN